MKKPLIAQERATPNIWLPPWTVKEHEARYHFSAKFVTNKRVADCACGNGIGASVFIRENPLHYYGFDISAEAIDYARSTYGAQRIEFLRADCSAIPIDDGTVDTVISLETIEHVENDKKFVQEIARILAPGGTLVMSTPNRLVYNPGTLISDKPWNAFHTREYSPDELQSLLKEDFIVEQWHGQNRVSNFRAKFMSAVGRWIGRRIAVLINQIWKCRWFVFPSASVHLVKPISSDDFSEYIVVVCRKK